MATFLYNSQRGIETIGEFTRLLRKTLVGGNHCKIIHIFFDEVTRLEYLGGQFIDGDIKEALYLARVHIHGQDAVGAGDGNAVGDEAGGDGDARLVFFIGTAIGIVGNDGGDAGGGGALEGVDHDEEFHNGAIDGEAEGLNDKYVAPTHVVVDLHEDIFIAELKNICVTEWDAQMFADRSRQWAVRITGKDTQIVHSLLLVELSISHGACLCKPGTRKKRSRTTLVERCPRAGTCPGSCLRGNAQHLLEFIPGIHEWELVIAYLSWAHLDRRFSDGWCPGALGVAPHQLVASGIGQKAFCSFTRSRLLEQLKIDVTTSLLQ